MSYLEYLRCPLFCPVSRSVFYTFVETADFDYLLSNAVIYFTILPQYGCGVCACSCVIANLNTDIFSYIGIKIGNLMIPVYFTLTLTHTPDCYSVDHSILRQLIKLKDRFMKKHRLSRFLFFQGGGGLQTLTLSLRNWMTKAL